MVPELGIEQPRQFAGTLPAREDPTALQDDTVWRDITLDVLFKAVLARKAKMVLEDFLGRSAA